LLADHPNQVDGLYNRGAIYLNQHESLRRASTGRRPWPKSGLKAKGALQKFGPRSLPNLQVACPLVVAIGVLTTKA